MEGQKRDMRVFLPVNLKLYCSKLFYRSCSKKRKLLWVNLFDAGVGSGCLSAREVTSSPIVVSENFASLLMKKSPSSTTWRAQFDTRVVFLVMLILFSQDYYYNCHLITRFMSFKFSTI